MDELKEINATVGVAILMEVQTGRIKRAIIDIFFDSYFQLFIQDKQYNISNEDKLMYSRVDRLAQSYQHFINKYCGGNKNIVLDQMKEYAECFRNNLKPNQCGMSIPKEEGIERINVVIFGLKRGRINGVRKHSGYFGEYLYFAYGYVLYR